jgi:hypothetical protein
MDGPRLSIPHSPTLPMSTDDVKKGFHCDSEIVNPDAPMTPPMSPRQSEEGDKAVMIDIERRFSGLSPQDPAVIPPGPNSENLEAPLQEMEVEEPSPASPPRPPARLLEDEQVHVVKPGALKLTDFEVKGTLGAQRWFFFLTRSRSFC